MSVNKYKQHVYILPEDDANRELANGFYFVDGLDQRQMQVLPVAGGWNKVVDGFKQEHILKMNQNENRFMVLLLDFDEQEDRLNAVMAEVPDHLKDRVFVLGVWTQPEPLRTELGISKEKIGEKLANECRNNNQVIWDHPLLRHNAGELERLRSRVRPILFPQN